MKECNQGIFIKSQDSFIKFQKIAGGTSPFTLLVAPLKCYTFLANISVKSVSTQK